MQDDTVRKTRVFWAWMDEQEEQWLREMASKGYHLSQPLFPCVYSFTRGEPRDVAYRLDYLNYNSRRSAEDRKEYLQVFQDAGWEHVGEMAGWQYFRKPVLGDEVPEIYTDVDSKVQKYRRLLGYLIVFMPILVVMLTSLNRRAETPFGCVLAGLQVGIALLLIYGFVRIALRIRQLRRL
jgi:hypothetical protein